MKTPWNETPRRFRPGQPLPPNGFPASVATETDFPVTFNRSQEHPLEALKTRLLREILGTTLEPALLAPIRRAANDAAAIAWLESHPLLVFPELFAEKIRSARGQVRQQRQIRTRTARLTEVFA